jgi:hypothetical protein
MALIAQDQAEDMGGVAIVVRDQHAQRHRFGSHETERTPKKERL